MGDQKLVSSISLEPSIDLSGDRNRDQTQDERCAIGQALAFPLTLNRICPCNTHIHGVHLGLNEGRWELPQPFCLAYTSRQFPQPSHICRERIVASLLQHVPCEDGLVHTRGLLLSTAGSPGRIRYLAKRHRTFQTELHQSHLSHLSHADVSN